MTLTFRSLGKKCHHSIWCFQTLYVLVLFSLTFVLSGGLELVSSSSFFPWLYLQESYHHITCHSLRCCPVSNSVSLVSPPKFADWDPLCYNKARKLQALSFFCSANWFFAKLWFGVGRKWKLLEQKALIYYFKLQLWFICLLLCFHQAQ